MDLPMKHNFYAFYNYIQITAYTFARDSTDKYFEYTQHYIQSYPSSSFAVPKEKVSSINEWLSCET